LHILPKKSSSKGAAVLFFSAGISAIYAGDVNQWGINYNLLYQWDEQASRLEPEDIKSRGIDRKLSSTWQFTALRLPIRWQFSKRLSRPYWS